MINKALKNNPALAGLATLLMGASIALTVVGIAIPALAFTMVQILATIMLVMGVIHFALKIKGVLSATPFRDASRDSGPDPVGQPKPDNGMGHGMNEYDHNVPNAKLDSSDFLYTAGGNRVPLRRIK